MYIYIYIYIHHEYLLQVHTCPPAMGDSFAAGTIDGPGAFSFRQSMKLYIHVQWNISIKKPFNKGHDFPNRNF